jgi:hypothetical protein
MGFEDRPGNRPIGSKPPQTPLPPSYTGPSIEYKPDQTAPMKQLPDNIFGFFMLMMGL